jgi:hypothetical protein
LRRLAALAAPVALCYLGSAFQPDCL